MQRYDTLVMGGGGFKSIAYLGAMEEMNRLGIGWDAFCAQLKVVAGSSAGSFSAACVAAGVPLDKLDAMMRN
jgi:predicted acylesterase/phospholipase RssA